MLQKWKRVAVIAVSSGMSQILTLVFGLLLVRVLSTQDYAIYRQGMLMVNTLLPFFAILSPISLSYFFARSKTEEEKKYYVIQTVEILCLLSFVGTLMVFLFKEKISELYNNTLLVKYIPAFAIILFVESATQYFPYYMVCMKREKVLMTVTIAFSLFRTLLLVIVLFLNMDILKRFLFIYTIAELARGCFLLGYTMHLNRGVAFSLHIDVLVSQFKFSVPIYLMGLINALNTNLDKNVVAILYHPELYAIYENGAYQIPFVNSISSSIIAVMLPDIAQRFKAEDKPTLDGIIREYNSVIRVGLGIFAAAFTALFTFSKGVILFLFTEVYIESVQIFRVYLLMILFQALNLGVLLTSADRQMDIVKAGVVMVLANLVLLLGINRIFGFYQLVYAPVTSTLIMNILLLGFIKKVYLQSSIWSVIPVRYFLSLAIPMGLVGMLFTWIQRLVPMEEVLETIILGPLCFAVAAVTAFTIMKIERIEE